jgi:pyrimidine operon attenuation protein/uracil phosphoribosyltransferase
MGVTTNGTRQVMDGQAINRSVVRIAHEVVERNRGADGLALIGILSRGVYLAQRLRRSLQEIAGGPLIPFGVVDITPTATISTAASRRRACRARTSCSRSRVGASRWSTTSFTGRTGAAMDALVDFGRPQSIQLAVLVDRGHRELPIRADYVGKNLPTSRREQVQVRLAEADGVDEVVIES